MSFEPRDYLRHMAEQQGLERGKKGYQLTPKAMRLFQGKNRLDTAMAQHVERQIAAECAVADAPGECQRRARSRDGALPHRDSTVQRADQRVDLAARGAAWGETERASAKLILDRIAAASWDSVIFDLPGHESLQRVPTIDPLRGSRQHVGALLDRCETAEELFAALTR